MLRRRVRSTDFGELPRTSLVSTPRRRKRNGAWMRSASSRMRSGPHRQASSERISVEQDRHRAAADIDPPDETAQAGCRGTIIISPSGIAKGAITLTLNDDGDCRYRIDGKGEYLCWQVLCRMLEPLFFTRT